MIQWGLISKLDSETIMATLDLIMKDTPPNKVINTTEIGIFDGETSRAINSYIKSKGYDNTHIAIDSHKDFPTQKPFEGCIFIEGNSHEVYNRLEDGSQDFIFVDGNHSFPSVISDWYCYKSKVKKGGFICFHDSAPQAQGRDWQRMGDEKDADMSISVVKALQAIGLLPIPRKQPNRVSYWYCGWDLIFDEWDENDRCGGAIVFKKTME